MPNELKQTSEEPPGRRFALFDLGFRPFFLGAGVMGVVWMALWLPVTRGLALDDYYGVHLWHAHEMLFGYTVAVIAGFLLTAVENWTEVPTPRGAPLAALFGLWCAARLGAFFPGVVPPIVNAGLDLAFLPVLAGVLAVSLIQAGGGRNLIFLLILGLLAVANLLVHLEVLGARADSARDGTVLGLGLVILAIAMIGGRVFPMFTARVPGVSPRSWPGVEAAALGALVLFLLAVLARPGSAAAGAAALVAGVCHAVRLWGWYDRRIWRVPLVWVLHLGYAWVVAGFFLWALAAFGEVPHALAVHAFTAGGIGVLTVGMMARVALGHTDRRLDPARPVVAAFVLLNLAAVARVVLPLAAPGLYPRAVALSGALWLMAFVLFLAVYVPILVGPAVNPPEA
jgi:uncharacterized protein involved in response to NO